MRHRKRTSGATLRMSALGHWRTLPELFDDFVSVHKEADVQRFTEKETPRNIAGAF